MKKMLLVVLFVAVFICAGAQAERHTGGMLPISTENAICLNPVFPNGDAPGDDAPGDDAPGDDTPGDDTPGDDTPYVDGPEECVTGTEYTWSITWIGENLSLDMCILDNSYSDPDLADLMYSLTENDMSMTYTFYSPGEYRLVIIDNDTGLEYYYDIHVSDGGDNVVRQRIREIKAENPKTGEYARALWFYDWLLDHCEFDESLRYLDMASPFLRGTGTNGSYVRALALLLEEDGIDCRRITGYVYGERHTWIAMKLDGVWCLCDPTWDDDCYSIYGERYFYFGMTDALCALEREDPFYIGGAVTCDSMANYYFARDGHWTKYAPDTLSEYQSQRDLGCHCFLLPWCVDLKDSCLKLMLGEAAAWGLSHTDWQDDEGRTFRPEFVYCWDVELLVGRDINGGTLKLPESLKVVGAEAFADTAANHVIVPSGCVSIEAGAFEGMDLWEIVIPDSVTDIDENAFEGCGDVVIVANPDSAAAAFAEAHNLSCWPDVFT